MSTNKALSLFLVLTLTGVPGVAWGKCKPDPAKHWVCQSQPSHATGYVVPGEFVAKCQSNAELVAPLEKLQEISVEKSKLLQRCQAQSVVLTHQRDRAMQDVVALSGAVTEANAVIRQSNEDKAALAKVAHDLNSKLASSYTLQDVTVVGAVCLVMGMVVGFVARGSK